MIPPKNALTFPPLTGGCSEGLDASRCFFKQQRQSSYKLLRKMEYYCKIEREVKGTCTLLSRGEGIGWLAAGDRPNPLCLAGAPPRVARIMMRVVCDMHPFYFL